MRKTEAMIKVVKDKAADKEAHVLEIIEKMKKRKENISIYSVAKNAGVSRNYLYKNRKLFDVINKERNVRTTEREEASDQTVIISLKLKIAKLEKENKELKKLNYKENYDKLLRENADLKKQLEVAYKY